MDKDIRNLGIVVVVAVSLLYIFRPKKTDRFISKKLLAPTEAKTSDKEFENAIISIKAIRAAINDNVSSNDLNDLNKTIGKDYGLIVKPIKGKLFCYNKKNVAVAQEE